MSACKAGSAMWVYYHDFWQEDFVLTESVDKDYFEAMEMLQEYKREAQIDAWELWQDDPAFLDEEEENE